MATQGDGVGQPEAPKQLELPSTDSQSLPPVVPPQTSTPFQINQQFNVQQIPSKVWDKLSADQIFDLSKTILSQMERMDERQYEAAKLRIREQGSSDFRSTVIGGTIALAGVAATTYLAANGHETIAGIVGSFLATIIAVVVGKRLSG